MRISDWSSDVCSSDLRTAAMIDALRAFIEAHQAVLSLVILAAMFVGFLMERLPATVIAILGACACLALGILDADGLYSVFRSEEHTSELQSLMRISYAVFCLKKKNTITKHTSVREIHIQKQLVKSITQRNNI